MTLFSCVLTLLPAPFYCVQHNGMSQLEIKTYIL